MLKFKHILLALGGEGKIVRTRMLSAFPKCLSSCTFGPPWQAMDNYKKAGSSKVLKLKHILLALGGEGKSDPNPNADRVPKVLKFMHFWSSLASHGKLQNHREIQSA